MCQPEGNVVAHQGSTATVESFKTGRRKTTTFFDELHFKVPFQLIWIVTFVAVILLDISLGLGVGVGFSLIVSLVRTQW